MKITIPFKTPTINHLYWHRGNMKIMKKEAKALREEITRIIQEDTEHDPITSPPVKLKVNVDIHEDWYCKNGSVKRKDVLNREKFLIDSIFDALGIDDKFIFEHTMKKIQDEKEYAVIEIASMV